MVTGVERGISQLPINGLLTLGRDKEGETGRGISLAGKPDAERDANVS